MGELQLISNINKIQHVQNRAAKIVTGTYDYSISCSTLIKKLGWMTMNQRYFYFTSILVYKSMNGLTSKTLSDHFNKPLDVHNIETRFAKNNNLCLPHPRTNYCRSGIFYVREIFTNLTNAKNS